MKTTTTVTKINKVRVTITANEIKEAFGLPAYAEIAFFDPRGETLFDLEELIALWQTQETTDETE